MSVLLFLVTGLILCVSDETKQEESSNLAIQETQGKMNLLWMAILYPNMYEHLHKGNWIHAICEVKPSRNLEAGKPQVNGQVLFQQVYPHGKLNAIFYLDGFPPDSNAAGRAIHIHEFGDLSMGCDSAGGHYNPFKVNHPFHPGDFGNFYPQDGKIRLSMSNLQPSLFNKQAILGRSVVIHENADDMGKGNNSGSLEHGNAGKRLACCVIGFCKEEMWVKAHEELLKTEG
ncbi:extracellular superoxide dismutase [Cu-Zn] [Sphaerodactylus townsendi]|uniref:extracellular superoxide dismutase [Cu-Zn] n=1 Tax=Sphaerodactylus townsendi TaxID=933632 RepID=UPI002027047E|nr:extracellular superoxide dismutase [Cu-Zn] [Sphaerodactylus townsendi]